MTSPSEPQTEAYQVRKNLLAVLPPEEGLLGDLLRAAYDRYRISAWCGNEARGTADAIGILERVVATQPLDGELRDMILLTIEGMRSLTPSRRLEEIMLRQQGLMPADWPGFGDNE